MTRSPAAPAPAATMAGPVALVIGSCVSLQIGAAFAAQLFGALGSWGVTSLRLGIAATVLLLAVRPAVHRWDRTQWRGVLLFGLALGAMNGSFYASIARIPLGAAVAIEFLGPLVLSAVLSRRGADLLCVLVALLGVSMFGLESLTGGAALDPLGVVFALIAGVFWACYILTSARVGRLVPGHGGLAVAVGIGAVAILPLGGDGVVRGLSDPHLALLALGCALLASVIPYSLELSALRSLPSHVFGVLLSLEPAVAGLAGLVLLGQPLTVLTSLAIVLVVAASIGITLAARQRTVPGRGAEASDNAASDGTTRTAETMARTPTSSPAEASASGDELDSTDEGQVLATPVC